MDVGTKETLRRTSNARDEVKTWKNGWRSRRMRSFRLVVVASSRVHRWKNGSWVSVEVDSSWAIDVNWAKGSSGQRPRLVSVRYSTLERSVSRWERETTCSLPEWKTIASDRLRETQKSSHERIEDTTACPDHESVEHPGRWLNTSTWIADVQFYSKEKNDEKNVSLIGWVASTMRW